MIKSKPVLLLYAAVESRRIPHIPQRPVRLLFFSLLFFVTSLALGQARVPRWITELPIKSGVHYAIGECGKYFDAKKGSEEALRVAAFRLAASISVTIRFGLAADLESVSSRHISFTEVTIDTSMMEKLLREMAVIDSIQLDDSFLLLVGWGSNPSLPTRFKELVEPREDVPNWVLNPPSGEGEIYGIGTSFKRGVAGWENAERMARLSIAEQVALEVKTGTWSCFSSSEGKDETLTIQVGETTLVGSQLIARARDLEGVSYVLVRMPLPTNNELNPKIE